MLISDAVLSIQLHVESWNLFCVDIFNAQLVIVTPH